MIAIFKKSYGPYNISLLYIALLSTLVLSCKEVKSEWDLSIQGITSSSSPKCIDLTHDGIKDIVIGAGGIEWEKTDYGVIAIDGGNGKLLWHVKARNQIVGSAVFYDVNNDGTPDVIIGGRSSELQAIDGKNGKLLWEFYSKPGKFTAHEEGWYNFFNPQLVMDQDNDGIKDIVIANGGDAMLPAGMKYRPPGKLLLLSGKSGKIIAQALMPDAQETYLSIVCFDCDTNADPNFIFGSGGESKPGHLYLTKLSYLLQNKLNISIVLDSTVAKGYIAPPIVVDMNKDGKADILFNTSEASTCLVDGASYQKVWAVHRDSFEVYAQPAVGKFYGDDDQLDVYVSYAKGVYPDYKSTIQLLIDGKTGKVVKQYSDKRFVYSSPLVADMNGDGLDEIIFNRVSDIEEKPVYALTVLNFRGEGTSTLFPPHNGACFASTPWLGDLDNDGKMDAIYSGSPAIVSEYPGNTTYQRPDLQLTVHRKSLPKVNIQGLKWGEYMGVDSKSVWTVK